MTQKLEGKVAVVTGASSGIGEAMSGDKPLRVYALAQQQREPRLP